MPIRTKTVVVVSLVLVAGVASLAGMRECRSQRERAVLEEKARVRDEMCRMVKATLFVDRTSADQLGEFERVAGKVGTMELGVPYSFGDNGYFLKWCAPTPFPEAEWRACVGKHDIACMQTILQHLEDSIVE